MEAADKIISIYQVKETEPPPVKPMLSPEEKKFLEILADSFLKMIVKK